MMLTGQECFLQFQTARRIQKVTRIAMKTTKSSESDTRTELIHLQNVLNKSECDLIISMMESNTRQPGCSVVGQSFPVNETLANMIWSKVSHVVPKQFNGHAVLGLSEMIRLRLTDSITSRLTSRKHADLHFKRIDNSEFSPFTILIYLNDVASGGETTFFHSNGSALTFPPQAGSGLIFPCKTQHQANPILSGSKYVMVGRIMYQNKYFLCN